MCVGFPVVSLACPIDNVFITGMRFVEWLVTGLLLCEGACGTLGVPETLPLSSAAMKENPPKSLGISVSVDARFFASQDLPGDAGVRSLLGGGAAEAKRALDQGAYLTDILRIKDPARLVASALSSGLGRAYGVQTFQPSTKGVSPPSDLVLQIRTTVWQTAGRRDQKYDIQYEAEMKLTDSRSDAVIAHGKCRRPVASPTAPTWEELNENRDDILRQETKRAAEACARDLGTRLLGLPPG